MNGSILETAEIYDPTKKTFEPVGGMDKKSGLLMACMKSARFNQTATMLSNGSVLLTGGFGPGKTGAVGALNTGEIFIANKNKTIFGHFASAGTMHPVARSIPRLSCWSSRLKQPLEASPGPAS